MLINKANADILILRHFEMRIATDLCDIGEENSHALNNIQQDKIS
jgi:hypothetical protein